MIRLRCYVIILFMSIAVGFLGFFNDLVMRQTFIFGSYVPIFIYGLLLLVAIINPFLRRISPTLSFYGVELALITAVSLPTCYISSRTLIHHFTLNLMMPHHIYKTSPQWQQYQLLRRLPRGILAEVNPLYKPEDIQNPLLLKQWLEREEELSEDTQAKILRGTLKKLVKSHDDLLQISTWVAKLNEVLQIEKLFDSEAISSYPLSLSARELIKVPPKNRWEWIRLNRYVCDYLLGGKVISLEDREEKAVLYFVRGTELASNEKFSLHHIPWYAWEIPLLRFWIPVILCFSIGFMGLALVVYRQWFEHEHLAFPIVQFARSLLPEDGTTKGSVEGESRVLREKMFWVAMVVIAAIHLYNYAAIWWPKYLIRIPLQFDFYPLASYIPYLNEGGSWLLMNPTIYFTVIGFAYFVSREVSFSLGIGPYLFTMAIGFMAVHGIRFVTGGYNSLTPDMCFKAGAYFAVCCTFLYTGRTYYQALIKRAFGLSSSEDIRSWEILGLWLGVIFFCGGWFLLLSLGIKPLWAFLWILGFIIVFAVASRAVAESGMFLLQPHIFPSFLILGFFGPRVIGADQLLVLFFLCSILSIGTHVAVMCMSVHALQLVPDRPKQFIVWAPIAFIICLFVAIGTALYFQYKLGALATSDGWTQWLPTYAFHPTVDILNMLQSLNLVDEAGTYHGVEWFSHIRPHIPAVTAFLVAIILVLTNEFFRLRYSHWPIHSIMFLVGAFWHGRVLAGSFLLGWLVKTLIHRFGGPKSYQKLKPLMLGLIAGDMLASIIILAICAIYFLTTGEQPKWFWIFPG